MEVNPHKNDHEVGNAKDVVLSITEDTVEESQVTSFKPTISKCKWATAYVCVEKSFWDTEIGSSNSNSLKSKMNVMWKEMVEEQESYLKTLGGITMKKLPDRREEGVEELGCTVRNGQIPIAADQNTR